MSVQTGETDPHHIQGDRFAVGAEDGSPVSPGVGGTEETGLEVERQLQTLAGGSAVRRRRRYGGWADSFDVRAAVRRVMLEGLPAGAEFGAAADDEATQSVAVEEVLVGIRGREETSFRGWFCGGTLPLPLPSGCRRVVTRNDSRGNIRGQCSER